MKRFLSLFMSFVMLMSITTGFDLTVSAATSGNFEYEILDDGTIEITHFYDYVDVTIDLTIPSTIGGHTVSSIGDEAFLCCESLTSVIIPSSIIFIGNSAFEDCEYLTSVTIPNSLKSIGDFAFGSCYSLTSITIPDGVTDIGDNAFSFCKSLTNIEIPRSVTSIGWCAFYDCENLICINVDKDNENYFSEKGVLFNKDKTELIQYPIGSTKTSYFVPDGIISIDNYAFSLCTNLEYVTIPNSVTIIGLCALYYCENLTRIDVDSDNINYSSFEGVLFDKNKVELILYPMGNISMSYEIPNTVIRIADSAFESCIRLTEITIPNSVTSIGESAFYDCIRLKDVYYCSSKTNWNNISIGEYNECLTNANIYYGYHIHEFDDGEVTLSATCTTNGTYESVCKICGVRRIETIHATGHTVVADPAVAATCTANGLTEGSHCSVCGQVITAQQVIPATGHNFGNNQLNCSACGVTNPNYVAPQTTTKKPTAPSGAKKVDGVFVNSKYKKPTISKLSKGKKQIKVSWKKVSSVSGYQIQYSTSKKFTKKTTKSATISGNKSKTPSKTIKSLKAKKTYYVRVRTYKNVKFNGKTVKVYSGWSKVKAVKTK